MWASAGLTGHNRNMRYLVALLVGLAALFGAIFFFDVYSIPKPWNSLVMGGIVGVTMVLVLLIWEAVKPSHSARSSDKPVLSDEERAKARAERRARLAAEAGVSLDGVDSAGGSSAPATGATEGATSEASPGAAAPGSAEEADALVSPSSLEDAPPEPGETGSGSSAAGDSIGAGDGIGAGPDDPDVNESGSEDETVSSLEEPPVEAESASEAPRDALSGSRPIWGAPADSQPQAPEPQVPGSPDDLSTDDNSVTSAESPSSPAPADSSSPAETESPKLPSSPDTTDANSSTNPDDSGTPTGRIPRH